MVRLHHRIKVERFDKRTFRSTSTFRWDYVVEHNVQLPDEYDEIYHDLEPFWGIDPFDLQKTREELEKNDEIVVIEKTDESPYIEVVGRKLPAGSEDRLTERVSNILSLLVDVEDLIPPFRAVVSPHDNPGKLSDYGIRSMAIAAAATGSSKFLYIDIAL